MSRKDQQAEGITWVSPQSLIQLRLLASKLSLNSGKIHAKQGGAYLSSFKGRGMEFDESRMYLPGDDIRSMDWKVTARTNQPHTKVFREERERPVLLWLDLNPSMFFATRGAFKSVVATQAASLLAWSTVNNNDRLGALVFAGDQHLEIRPKRGKTAALDFIRRSCDHPAWQQTPAAHPARNMALATSRLRKVAKPGSLIFLISDFREMDDQAQSNIVNLSRHNNLVLIQIYDPFETALPTSGQYKVSDGMNDVSLNTANKKLRSVYQSRFATHQQKLKKLCRQHRMHLITIATEDDALQSLQQGLGIHDNKGSQFRAGK
ncbi:MAG: DUF58 domain-containing protein [Gammaproteobacteria bacterium]|nr:DUF58 domain-containing protein [Gammaproteobacteria bacterium]